MMQNAICATRVAATLVALGYACTGMHKPIVATSQCHHAIAAPPNSKNAMEKSDAIAYCLLAHLYGFAPPTTGACVMVSTVVRERTAEQQAVADEHNHGKHRAYRSAWAIDWLWRRGCLSPDNLAMAGHLAALGARARGEAQQSLDRVDCGNGVESALLDRLEAQQELAGYESAVRKRLSQRATACLWGIVEGDGVEALRKRMSYANGSNRAVIVGVQLLLETLQAYRNECEEAAKRWNGLDGIANFRHDNDQIRDFAPGRST